MLYLQVTLIYFDASLDAKGGTPTLKSRSINKLIELNKTLDLCHIGEQETLKSVNTLLEKNIYLELFNED